MSGRSRTHRPGPAPPVSAAEIATPSGPTVPTASIHGYRSGWPSWHISSTSWPAARRTAATRAAAMFEPEPSRSQPCHRTIRTTAILGAAGPHDRSEVERVALGGQDHAVLVDLPPPEDVGAHRLELRVRVHRVVVVH